MKVLNEKDRSRYPGFLTAVFFALAVLSFHAPLHSETAPFPPHKGMCYVTWDRHRFASRYSDESLNKLASLGVEYIAICVTHYQEKYNSTRIKRTAGTPSESSLIHVIDKSHELGFKVMIKPHLDLIDKMGGTYWRADIGFAREEDWNKWFGEYKRLMLNYARLAEKTGVELFCIGTELSFAAERTGDWRDIISEIRKVYGGELLYAANWDNFRNIKFWDDLDYAGIDAYFPLTYKPNPSVEDLEQGWRRWRREIEAWYGMVRKPVIFTEIGYASTGEAPYTPWKGGTHGNADPEIQARCYRAFFRTMWDQPWFAGAYWWKWDTNIRAGGKYDRQFTPQNKPAQDIIEANYKDRGRDTALAMAR